VTSRPSDSDPTAVYREQEAAEREAALALKAEIRESVEAYSLRLKEAQANKKEAAAALKWVACIFHWSAKYSQGIRDGEQGGAEGGRVLQTGDGGHRLSDRVANGGVSSTGRTVQVLGRRDQVSFGYLRPSGNDLASLEGSASSSWRSWRDNLPHFEQCTFNKILPL